MGRVYSAYNPARIAVDVDFTDAAGKPEASRTRQEFAAECDINNIMARFEATGVVSHLNPREPMYLDIGDGVPDLREAIDLVRSATESFMSLPAKVRSEFDNDPVSFVDFARDPNNVDKLREWGLAKPLPPVAAPMRVEVVSTAPDAAKDAPKP